MEDGGVGSGERGGGCLRVRDHVGGLGGFGLGVEIFDQDWKGGDEGEGIATVEGLDVIDGVMRGMGQRGGLRV